MKLARIAKLVAAGLLVVASVGGTASAHSSTLTTDGKYKLIVGNLNEPTTTYMKTGLDLIIRDNSTNAPVLGAQLTLNATLFAPNGKTLTQPLKGQFGAPGSYTFTDPYFLTEAGVYKLAVMGRINTTDVDLTGIIVGTSAGVDAMEDHAFPNDIKTPAQLASDVQALQTENAQLKSRLDALESKPKGNSPGPDAILLLAIIGVAALALRRHG